MQAALYIDKILKGAKTTGPARGTDVQIPAGRQPQARSRTDFRSGVERLCSRHHRTDRMNRIIDRSQALNAITDDDASKAHLKADIPRLKRRAALLNSAILFSAVSAIVTSLLVIVAFVCAFYNMRHEYAVAVLFVVALGFFTVSLVYLAREGRIALNELDHYS
jgi:hypothetical protein